MMHHHFINRIYTRQCNFFFYKNLMVAESYSCCLTLLLSGKLFERLFMIYFHYQIFLFFNCNFFPDCRLLLHIKMACVTLKRPLEFDPIHGSPGSPNSCSPRPHKRQRCLPMSISNSRFQSPQKSINAAQFLQSNSPSKSSESPSSALLQLCKYMNFIGHIPFPVLPWLLKDPFLQKFHNLSNFCKVKFDLDFFYD